MIDLHTHSTFSAGELIPAELIRRAKVAGYRAIAITDHADASNIPLILDNVRRLTVSYAHFFDMEVLAGVELTHVPPALMAEFAQMAREAGAQIVVCHGETVVEPVAQGTNLAAIEAGVDVLAHPGLITEVEARLPQSAAWRWSSSTRLGHSTPTATCRHGQTLRGQVGHRQRRPCAGRPGLARDAPEGGAGRGAHARGHRPGGAERLGHCAARPRAPLGFSHGPGRLRPGHTRTRQANAAAAQEERRAWCLKADFGACS
jgi:hypothetical protein